MKHLKMNGSQDLGNTSALVFQQYGPLFIDAVAP